MTFTWQGGRELTTAVNNGTTTAYLYNENGIRTKKTVGSTTTEYYLSGDTMVAEKKGSNLITYMFDENGERYGFLYNNTPYYYVRNIQGDVIRILNSSGSIVAKYEYDAWGKVLKVTNANDVVQTSSTFIGNINPIRYRGYYYDAETGFYYLQSRYYDPETGRFINADEPEILCEELNILLSKDLYAYCNNCPTMNVDCYGNKATMYAAPQLPKNVSTAINRSGLKSKDWVTTQFYGGCSNNLYSFTRLLSSTASLISKFYVVTKTVDQWDDYIKKNWGYKDTLMEYIDLGFSVIGEADNNYLKLASASYELAKPVLVRLFSTSATKQVKYIRRMIKMVGKFKGSTRVTIALYVDAYQMIYGRREPWKFWTKKTWYTLVRKRYYPY